MENEGKMNFSELARRVGAGVSSHTTKFWWSRREELEETGSLHHKPRSGRPSFFSSPDEIDEAIEICENLEAGYHQRDAARQIGCSVSTLYRHTQKEVSSICLC